ncbi:MAG: cytochrome c oxidase assembly protein [Alphaproteobacteria bacterium]|nr:cytochrome c oxidase assembly protein [Alphaproteobacteria bacterium]
MKESRRKNLRVLALAGAMIGASTTLVVYSPTLYRMFCAATGYGGTVNRAIAEEPGSDTPSARQNDTVTLSFDANVAPGLPWAFYPEQRKVETRLGQPTKIYYYAKNNSDRTIVARAIYNVTPYGAAPYFFKIECFCFTNEKLAPGESARMPVELYVDEQMAKDPDARDIHDITLSYTFYRQNDLSPEALTRARNLKAGSETLDATLQREKGAEFENDAPRH